MFSKQALHILDVVAQTQSFSAAAHQLHKVPSAISYSVRQVEQELGVILFERQPRKVVLTPAGEHFIREARQILRNMDELKAQTQRVGNGWSQTLRLTLDNIVKLEPLEQLIQDFYQAFDFAELQVNMEVYNGAWEAISENRTDIVIGATSAIPVNGQFAIKEMGTLDWAFVMSPELAKLPEEDLIHYPAICLDDTSTILPKRYTWHYASQRRLLLPNWFSAIECLKTGVGMGFMPRHMARHFISRGDLVEKPLRQSQDQKSPLSSCCLVWNTDTNNQLVDWMIEYLGDSEKLFQDWLA